MNVLLHGIDSAEAKALSFESFPSLLDDLDFTSLESGFCDDSKHIESLTCPQVQVLLKKKMDADEKIVRQELVKVWTRILEKYARPGAQIPSPDAIRKELLDVGVRSAVDAVIDAHWFVFSFMIHDEIQNKVNRGLDRFDIPAFIQDVKAAQNNPVLLNKLREQIRRYVLFDDF